MASTYPLPNRVAPTFRNTSDIAPICPHDLTQRPLVVPASRFLELVLASEKDDVCVTLDGQPGRYRCEVEEIVCERTGNLEEDVRRLTAAHAAALAARVRRHPDHYFWQHRRWR